MNEFDTVNLNILLVSNIIIGFKVQFKHKSS